MIYLCLAHMSGNEQKYIQEAFDTNWVVPCGPNVDGFEKDLEEFFSVKNIVALCSGTASTHLALLAAGVGKDDEVLVQSFCFVAAANPVRYVGATPVFVDSEPMTWNMSPELLEKAVIDRKAKTGKYPKAIIVVDLFGMPAMLDEIVAVANKYNIVLIEDAANAFGSKYNGKMCGTFGRFGVLSFNGNKMITTSGGGALICPDAETKNKIMWYATQAREAYPYYQHEAIGYNYRLSNICAGIGRGQMTVANEHIEHHRHIAEMYRKAFEDIEGVTFHDEMGRGEAFSNFWLCTITLDTHLRIKGQENAYGKAITGAVGGAAGVVHQTAALTTDCQPDDNVEALRMFMDAAGIEARPLWKPMHKQPVYHDCPAYLNGVSEALFKKGMCLPSGPCVTDDDVRYIIDCIKNAIEK